MAVAPRGQILTPLQKGFVAEKQDDDYCRGEATPTPLLVLQPVGEQEEEKNPGQWKQKDL